MRARLARLASLTARARLAPFTARRVMSASAAGALVALALVSLSGEAAPIDEPPLGYDHISHEGKVSVSGAEPIPCERCHAIDASGRLVGRPGHAACFGACHGAEPTPRRAGATYRIAGDQRRVCEACHSPAVLSRVEAGGGARLTVRYPPYDANLDHGLAMSHATHAEPARAASGCLGCHDAPPDPRPAGGQSAAAVARAPTGRPAAGQQGPAAPHARCATCHLAPARAGMPSMRACAACHPAAYGPSTRPHLVRGIYPVRAAFSHASHLRRASGTERDCGPCHDAVWTSAGNEIPAPTMQSCGGCHDGKAAFSIVTTECRRCHVETTERPGPRERPGLRYSHEAHDKRGTLLACKACHALDPRGQPTPPAPDHAPCSNDGCHRSDFWSPTTKFCSACHLGMEPWRPLHADRTPPAETEFGAVFPHAPHLARLGSENAACGRCHRPAGSPRDLRTGGGHAACTGAGCHAAAGGPAPRLGACEGCHRLGIVAARTGARRAAEFSVRARFRHAPHRAEPASGEPVACSSCHAGIEASTGLDDVPTPGKPACVRCHDGAVAFKVTGHGCARCHGAAGAARPANRR